MRIAVSGASISGLTGSCDASLPNNNMTFILRRILEESFRIPRVWTEEMHNGNHAKGMVTPHRHIDQDRWTKMISRIIARSWQDILQSGNWNGMRGAETQDAWNQSMEISVSASIRLFIRDFRWDWPFLGTGWTISSRTQRLWEGAND
jgi:hypothetical protein